MILISEPSSTTTATTVSTSKVTQAPTTLATSPTASTLQSSLLRVFLATLQREKGGFRSLIVKLRDIFFLHKLWLANCEMKIWLFQKKSNILFFFHKFSQSEVGKLLCRQFWLKLVPTIRRPLIAFSNSSNLIWFWFADISLKY